MAQLTWRNIEAPNIDTRGMAIATQGITGSFDRLAQMFNDREVMARQRATDDAAANLLAIQDPAALQAAIAAQATGGGPASRINRREVLDVGNKAVQALQQRQLTNEQILEAQDPAKYAQGYMALAQAQRSGDPAAIATAMAGLEGARGILGAADKGIGWGDTDADNTRGDMTLGETIRSNKVGEGQRAQQLALQRQEAAASERHRAFQRAQEGAAGGTMALADGFAKKFAGMSPNEAMGAFMTTPEYRSITNAKQAQLAAGTFAQQFQAWSQPTELTANGKDGAPGFKAFKGTIGAERAQLATERGVEESAFWDSKPFANVLRTANTDKNLQGMSFDALADQIGESTGFNFSSKTANTRRLLQGKPGRDGEPALPSLTPGELAAGLQVLGGPDWQDRNLARDGGVERIAKLADQIKATKRDGGLAQAQREASNVLAPYRGYEAGLEELERRAGAAANTNGGEFNMDAWQEVMQKHRDRYRNRSVKGQEKAAGR